MYEITFKPFRKPVHLFGVTDEEIRWKMEARQNNKAVLKNIKLKKPALFGDSSGKTPPKMSIVSDARGKIENILLTVPPFYDQKNPSTVIDPLDERHLKTLIKHLSHRKRQYTLVCHANQVKSIRKWFRDLNISKSDYTLCISVFSYSIWAQDAYIALRGSNNRTILCEGVCFTRDQDMTVADDLSYQTKIQKLMSYLYFQGGNILETTQMVLVGKDYIVENTGRPFLETEKKVLKAFSDLLNRSVLSVGRQDIIPASDREHLGGGIFQPLFHLDMYITPTGKKGKKGKEIIFVGSPKLARKIVKEKTQPSDHDHYFDETAEQLSAYFDVRRLPLYPSQFRTRPHDNSRYYFLTYNNVILETFYERSRRVANVYLPSYAEDVKMYRTETYFSVYYGDEAKYKKLDKAARGAWEKVGFKVYQMDGLENLAMSWGAVHCIAKTLERSPYRK